MPKKPKSPIPIDQIDGMIRTIRGTRVMLDRYLAKIYGVPTKAFNQSTAVSRGFYIIQNGRLDLKYLHIVDKDRAKFVLKRGDILVNRTNSAELVGKCAVFDLERDFAFASYLIRLRLDTNKADPVWSPHTSTRRLVVLTCSASASK